MLPLVAGVMQHHPLLLETRIMAHSHQPNGALVVRAMVQAVMVRRLIGLHPGSWMV